jgi:hypothetical protein
MSALAILQALTDAGVTLTVDGDRLKYQAAAGVYTAELKVLVKEHREAIVAHLGAKPAVYERVLRVTPPAPEKTLPGGDWALALTPNDLPRTGFTLRPGVTVNHPRRWLAQLQADVAQGLKGPRARYGAVQEDIANLRQVIEEAF